MSGFMREAKAGFVLVRSEIDERERDARWYIILRQTLICVEHFPHMLRMVRPQ